MTTPDEPQALVARITAYLSGGGLFNPELANHDAVRDLLIECRAALASQPVGVEQVAQQQDLAEPSGGIEAGPEEDRIEDAFWRFDARHKGYNQWKAAPMSERDAFKAEMRNALAAEKTRAQMRLVAQGWRKPAQHPPSQSAAQPRLTVRLQSFPESNGKRNWTALLVRVDPWGGLIGNCGGITVARGELWNRVAYEAECAKLLIGERDTEPHILDYGDDIETPEQWAGEVRGGRTPRQASVTEASNPPASSQEAAAGEREWLNDLMGEFDFTMPMGAYGALLERLSARASAAPAPQAVPVALFNPKAGFVRDAFIWPRPGGELDDAHPEYSVKVYATPPSPPTAG